MEQQRPLETELARLREQLDDAEDVQRAIANGEVDGFVVGPNAARKEVLLLSHAYLRYRQLVERMQHGAVTVSTSGDVLYANRRFARFLAEPLGRLFGEPLQTFVDAADAPALNRFLASGEENAELTVRFRRSDGALLPAHLQLAAFSDGYASVLVTDLAPQPRLQVADETLEAIQHGRVDAVVVNGEQVVMLHRDPRRLELLALAAEELKCELAPMRRATAQLARAAGLDAESRLAVGALERHGAALERLVEGLLGVQPAGLSPPSPST